MARDLSYRVVVDSSAGSSGVTAFARTVTREMRAVDASLDDTATAGARVAQVLSAMADTAATDLKAAEAAADALAAALGPEMAAEMGRAGIGDTIADLRRMGLTFEEIEADADQLAAALKQIDGVKLDAVNSGLATSKRGVDDLGVSAGSSKSVLANMVGNATQDLGALGGVAGSAGVAIGQMGEYMADAASSGESFGSVLGNFAKVAGPIAGIALATQAISSEFARINAGKAFDEAQVKRFRDVLKDGGDRLKFLNDELEETGELVFKLRGGFDAADIGGDIAPILAGLSVSLAEFDRVVGDEDRWTAFIQGMKDAGVAEEDLITLQVAHNTILAQQTTAAEQVAAAAKLTAEEKSAETVAWEKSERAIDLEQRAKLRNNDATYKANATHRAFVDTLAEEARKADNLARQFDAIESSLDMEQAILDFQENFLGAIAKTREGTALSADEILGLKRNIVEVGEYADLNPVEVQALLDQIDQGNIEGVAALAQAALDRKKLQLQVDLILSQGSRAWINGQSGPPIARSLPPDPDAPAGLALADGLDAPAGRAAVTLPVTVTLPAPAVTVDFRGAMLGSHYDILRTVRRATAEAVRLAGSR